MPTVDGELERKRGPGPADTALRWIVAAYLGVSAVNFAVVNWSSTGEYSEIRAALSLLSGAALVLGLLVARGIVWPLTALALVLISVSAVAAIEAWTTSGASGEVDAPGRTVSLLHPPVLIVLSIWGCVRGTRAYRDRPIWQRLTLVAVLASLTSILPGGVQNTWSHFSEVARRG